MKRQLLRRLSPAVLVAMLALLCSLAACSSSDSAALLASRGVAGTWHYDGASVEAHPSNAMAHAAKPIAKSKLKSKLSRAYSRVHIDKSLSRLTLGDDGTFALRLAGPELRGTYTLNAAQGRLTLHWHGLDVTAAVRRDRKHLHLLFDTRLLMRVVELASGLSGNKTVQALSFLHDNYNDVQVGFAFKQ